MSESRSIKFGQFGLSLIAVFAVDAGISQQLLATEVNLDDSTETKRKSNIANVSRIQQSETESNQLTATNNISYKAADLQPEQKSTLVERIIDRRSHLTSQVDIDTFCKKYPLNSRCANYQSPVQQQELPATQQLEVTRQLSGFAVTGKVGTLGIGIEGTGAISPNFNGRLGVNAFGLGFDLEETDIEYDTDLSLFSISALADYFPFGGNVFRITGGLLYQNNQADITAQPAGGTIEIGGVDFPTEQLGELEGEFEFPNSIAPYVGIGFGNPVRQSGRVNFTVDLGVMFAGSPEVELDATNPVLDTIFAAAIEQEEEDLEDDLDRFSVYPVISIGVSYQF